MGSWSDTGSHDLLDRVRVEYSVKLRRKKAKEEIARLTTAARVRLALQELGPTL